MAPLPSTRLAPLSEALAREVCTWRYPPPHDIYGMGPWEYAVAEGWGPADPGQREQDFLAVLDAEDTLVAFLRLSHHHGRPTLGIGLHPDRCGQGLGPAVVELGWLEHQRRHPGEPLWLELRDWNQRAQRCYARAGFVAVDTVDRVTPLGPGRFVVMRREG